MSTQKPESLAPGWFSGWLVVQDPPRRLIAVYALQADARHHADGVINGDVHWGSHRPGTGEFSYVG